VHFHSAPRDRAWAPRFAGNENWLALPPIEPTSTKGAKPYFYMSFHQVHYGSGEGLVAVYARTGGDARGFLPVLSREMSAIDPNMAGLTAMPLSEYISAAWFGPRLASMFLGVLGGISMLLAGVGLYGVLAYGTVLQMVMRQGFMLALIGIAACLFIALAAAPNLAPLLYRVSPADPVSIVGAALFLIVVALLASLIPALRATRVDAMTALRQD
jgi:putative ABC transport system permease protein